MIVARTILAVSMPSCAFNWVPKFSHQHSVKACIYTVLS